MATVRQMLERANEVNSTLLSIVGNVMLQDSEQLVALIVHQQYDENVDSEGNPLRKYTYSYAKLKKEFTGRGDKTDLNLTGEFQATINIRVDGDVYEFNSPSQTNKGELKSAWLKNWQGAEIMEYTTENRKAAWLIIRPDVVEQVQNILTP